MKVVIVKGAFFEQTKKEAQQMLYKFVVENIKKEEQKKIS